MKKLTALMALLLAGAVHAQKVDVKGSTILVDGKEWAKLSVEKKNFGMTKNFEVSSLGGEKLLIAVPATEFEQDKTDNSYLFYRITFLPADQIGIFKVQALGQEKSFAKLIGTSGILVGDKLDAQKVREFIARSGASPKVAVDYTTVARNRSWPLRLQSDRNFEQDGKIIGSFVARGTVDGIDYYEFLLPSGVVVARAGFTGGNNAQNMELFTAKDNQKRTVPLSQKEKILAADTSIDKHQFTLQRIAKWLVENAYL